MDNEIKKIFKDKGLPDNFCLVPFTTLILEPNGMIGVCRQKGSDMVIGNVKDKKILDVWNSDEIKKWRQEFINGEVRICQDDIRYNSCNICPENNKILKDIDINVEQNKPPLKLALNLDSKCNLKCRMCNIWQGDGADYDRYELEEILYKNIKEIDMLSGEPFVQKNTYRLMNKISKINPECEWTISTNGHWRLNETIKNYLDKIKVKNIVVSLDSLKHDIYKKIKGGGNLKLVLENVQRLKEYEKERLNNDRSSLGLKINVLVQSDNWMELPEILRYLNKQELAPYVTYLYEPSEYSINSLNDSQKCEIADYLLNEMTWEECSVSMRVIRPIIDKLPKMDRAAKTILLNEKRLKNG